MALEEPITYGPVVTNESSLMRKTLSAVDGKKFC